MNDQRKFAKAGRNLSPSENDLVNKIKSMGEQVGKLVKEIESISVNPNHSVEIDCRWLSIGKTDLQKGFMALTRSIAKPEGF